jgi:hypothetical protein
LVRAFSTIAELPVIAIPTKCLEPTGIVVLCQPRVELRASADFAAMPCSIVINVVDAKKNLHSLSATGALPAIVIKNGVS